MTGASGTKHRFGWFKRFGAKAHPASFFQFQIIFEGLAIVNFHDLKILLGGNF
jgi:hypothetical protein